LPNNLKPAEGVLIVHGGLGDMDEMDKGIWVNAGRAGRSCNGDARTAVAILSFGGSGWDASLHRVDIDQSAVVQAISESDIPHAERMIETQQKSCW
jgi:hypothetical protein